MSSADQISTNGLSPASATVDGQTVAQHPIPAQIAGDRYAAATKARKTRNRGVMYSKILPAGAMPDSQGTSQGGNAAFDSPGV